jgi:hypothetical protein
MPTIESPLVLTLADLAEQTRVRLPLPIVKGNKDYREREALLRRMDEILEQSEVESRFLATRVAEARAEAAKIGKRLTDRKQESVQLHAKQTLRCTIARVLSNESHRSFSCHLAESPLLQWFCGIKLDGIIHVPTKSTLQRMEESVPADMIIDLSARLVGRATMVDKDGRSVIGLLDAVDLSLIWMDSTCAKLDIHYPTDWVLLRDATRTIMKAITVIRSHGLMHRMPAPEKFIATMNAKTMAMSGASRRGRGGDKKRDRKRVLREMKQIVSKVRRHGQRYRDLLKKSWSETDLSERQAQRIIERIDNILTQLPAAIKQAHERIIGERIVPNEEKTFSFYQPHAQVYVRGKSGADVEFGLQILVSESSEGLIVDCHVSEELTNDSKLLMPAIERMRKAHGGIVATTAVTDRGFKSQENDAALEKMGITNSTLPRNPEEMKKLLDDPKHRDLHRRRAQTEARIAILKGKFIGDHLPTRNRTTQVRFIAWATLAHNLWVLSRLDRAKIPLAESA